MTLESAFSAHQGGREEQQDHVDVLVAERDRLLVVADGMGGHAGGQIASRAALETARQLWQQWDRDSKTPQEFLGQVIATAHEAINRLGEEQGLQPRSTCVMLYLDGERAVWSHVGDSRLYRFRDGKLQNRTRDHSVPQMLLDMGKITEEDVATHPDQNRLTQSLGGDSDPEPDFGEESLKSGDAFLLCSDGLWERVTPDRMIEALYGGDLDELVRVLPQEAYDVERHSSDNISVAVARLDVLPAALVPGAEGASAAGASSGSRSRKPILGGLAAVLILGAIGVVAAVGIGGRGTPPAATGGNGKTSPGGTEKPKSVPKPSTPANDLNPAKQRRSKTVPGRVEPPAQRRLPPGSGKTNPAKKSKDVKPKDAKPVDGNKNSAPDDKPKDGGDKKAAPKTQDSKRNSGDTDAATPGKKKPADPGKKDPAPAKPKTTPGDSGDGDDGGKPSTPDGVPKDKDTRTDGGKTDQ